MAMFRSAYAPDSQLVDALSACPQDGLPALLAECAERYSGLDGVDEFAGRLQGLPFPTQTAESAQVVAMFYPRLGNGGIEREITLLARLYESMGKTVVVFTETACQDDYDLPETTIRETLPAVERENRRDSMEQRLRALADALSRHGVDVLVNHAWLNVDMAFDALLCRLLGVGYYVNAHGVFSFPLVSMRDDGALFSALPHVFELCSGIVTQTSASAAFFRKACDKVFVIPNCLVGDLPEREGASPGLDREGFDMLWVGRFDAYKRPEEALHVLARAKELGVEKPRLTFLGKSEDGLYEERLSSLARELGVADEVVFAGYHDDVFAYYAAADLLLMTSEIEGFSMVLLEASSAGLPAVMYRLPYLAFDKSEGIVGVALGSADAAAAAVAKLAGDRGLLADMGTAARAFYDSLTAYDYVSAWNRVFSGDGGCYEASAQDEALMWDMLLTHYEIGVNRIRAERKEEIEAACGATWSDAMNLMGERVAAVHEEYENSLSFKLGRAITKVPRTILRRE